ncbi:hypothetical protein Tco_1388889, partial [Tanacetum coccineum]
MHIWCGRGSILGPRGQHEKDQGLSRESRSGDEATIPQTLKEAQSLNGKVASLNRFLSKSAEKSLPFFKTLKRCTKKSDFQWTPKAERAFQGMKQCIAELPMVAALRPKEELIMYLCAAREAVILYSASPPSPPYDFSDHHWSLLCTLRIHNIRLRGLDDVPSALLTSLTVTL